MTFASKEPIKDWMLAEGNPGTTGVSIATKDPTTVRPDRGRVIFSNLIMPISARCPNVRVITAWNR